MSDMQTRTVVITGASAGIGRAAARLFGARGDRVALIARGQAGLEGATRDVQEAGGQALAISADMADYDQVVAAARQAQERFGPIDVWVNVAFTSVFAPFSEITAEEFRRVTEVSYLGFVHGTMAALALMRPRGVGVPQGQAESGLVRVGSHGPAGRGRRTTRPGRRRAPSWSGPGPAARRPRAHRRGSRRQRP